MESYWIDYDEVQFSEGLDLSENLIQTNQHEVGGVCPMSIDENPEESGEDRSSEGFHSSENVIRINQHEVGGVCPMSIDENPEKSGEDRFIKLTNSILLKILSFLPVDDATKTLGIAPFGSLWTHIDCLRFRFNSVAFESQEPGSHVLRFMKFVKNTFLLHQNPNIEEFELIIPDLDLSTIESDNFEKDCALCVIFALLRDVKSLQLSGYFNPMVFLSHSLTNISLSCCRIQSLWGANCSFLNVLKLQFVDFDNISLEDILRGCSVLEFLYLSESMVVGNAEITIHSPSLRGLWLENNERTCEWSLSLFSCSRLSTMSIISDVNYLILDYCTALNEVTLDLRKGSKSFHEFDYLRAVFQEIQHIKVFSLGPTLCLVLTAWELNGVRSSSLRCTTLYVKSSFTGPDLLGISRLLRSCDELEYLELDCPGAPPSTLVSTIEEPLDSQSFH